MNNDLVLEYEKTVLGQCLVNDSTCDNAFPAVREILDAADFYLMPHQLIYAAIVEMHTADKPITPLTVANQLEQAGDLKRVGGSDYLYELQAPIVETESAEHYAKDIKDWANERRACARINKLKQTFDDPTLSFHDKLAIFDAEREKINTSHEPSLEVVTTRELSEKYIEPIEWIVPDLLPNGLTLLAGDAKIGKSFFAWNIAISVATRGVALSSIDIEQKRNVLYLALEDPPALLQERLISLCSDGNIPDNINVIHNMNDIKLDAFGLKTLEGIIESTNSELVIIDTWKHVAPVIQDKNGTSYDIDYQRLIPVHRFVQAKGIAMILVMHTRKAADPDNPFNQIQGSMGVQAGCDTMLKIGRDSGGHCLHITGRSMPSDEYAISLSEGGIWELEGRVNDVRKTETRQVIIDMLVEAGDNGLTATDIITSSERKEGAVRLQLRRMLRDGDIIQPNKRGRYYYQNDDDDNITL